MALTKVSMELLEGVTATAAELNILDGVTSTAAELNILDTVTATPTELNYLDIATLGTIEASKAVTVDASGVISGIAKFGGGIQEPYTDLTSGTSVTLDLSLGTVFNLTLGHNVGTFTWTNYAGADYASSFVLRVKQDGTGSRSLEWPTGVDWAAGTAPELSTGANEVDVYVFLGVDNLDGGTLWHGFTAGQVIS